MAWNFTKLTNLKSVDQGAFRNSGRSVTDKFVVDFSGITTLTSFGSYAFDNTGALEINLNGCTGVSLGTNNVFSNNANLKTVDLTDCPITIFGTQCFYNNKLLDTIIGWDAIKNTVTRFNNYCFAGCSSLDVNMENMPVLTNVNQRAFYQTAISSGIKNWPIIKTIDQDAFCEANNLAYVDLSGSTIQVIGAGAFSGTNQNTISICSYFNASGCSDLTTIGQSAFHFCSLEYINLDNCTSLTTAHHGFIDCSQALDYITMRNCTSFTGSESDYMFYDNYFISLTTRYCDMTGCTALKVIPINFVAGHKNIKRVGWLDDLTDDEKTIYFPHSRYPALESIRSGAFTLNDVDKLVFDGLIGEVPLSSSCITITKKSSRIEFSMKDCPNATVFGCENEASTTALIFEMLGNVIMDLGVWPNCKTTQLAMHGGSQIGSVEDTFTLDEAFPNLEVIGTRSFVVPYCHNIKCLNGKITTIGPHAFGADSNNYVAPLPLSVEITAAPNLEIGRCAFQYFASVSNIKINGASNSLVLHDRCFGYVASSTSVTPTHIYLPTMPTIDTTTWEYPSTISESIGWCIVAGWSQCNKQITLHLPASIESEVKQYARDLEDASVDGNIDYFITSSGGMTTTTGGSTGDKSCSVVNYYHNHSYYIQAYQWGNIWPERSAIAMSTPNHDNIAIVFDI